MAKYGEPWSIDRKHVTVLGDGVLHVRGEDGDIFDVHPDDTMEVEDGAIAEVHSGRQVDRVERLVDCVNACAGIADPSAIPAAIEALRDLLDGAEGGDDNAACHSGICARDQCAQCIRVDAARAALAKLAEEESRG